MVGKKQKKQKRGDGELKNTSYELFIAALSLISIFNLFLYWLIPNKDAAVLGVVQIMNGIFSVIFITDFSYRIYTATSRSGYFFHQYGWADLLASLPFPQFKVLRFFRIIRAFRIMRRLGVRRVFHEFISSRGGSALLTIFLLIILLLEFGGMAILIVEGKSPNANIKTASDAVWWIIVTVTTVGYGDRFPVTNPGRFIGVIVMFTGIGLVGTLTGFLANAFLAPRK